MTNLEDRVARLENAFVELVSLVRDLTEGQNRVEGTQNLILGTLSQVVQTQNQILETVSQVVQTQNRMLGALLEHSSDLTIIKSYLANQG